MRKTRKVPAFDLCSLFLLHRRRIPGNFRRVAAVHLPVQSEMPWVLITCITMIPEQTIRPHTWYAAAKRSPAL